MLEHDWYMFIPTTMCADCEVVVVFASTLRWTCFFSQSPLPLHLTGKATVGDSIVKEITLNLCSLTENTPWKWKLLLTTRLSTHHTHRYTPCDSTGNCDRWVAQVQMRS